MRWLFAHPLPVDHARIVEGIARAEKGTSGEIRVLVARHRTADAVAAARRHFDRMGMAGTPHRNAVLIFLAPRSRAFAVIGDRGVHEKCGDAFWAELASAMAAYFKRGDFTEGLLHGIERAGALLAGHFPPEPGARSEAPKGVKEVD
jgi:uncharacterized membrane protein